MSYGGDTWFTIADGFPPTLVTDRPATELKPNESPSVSDIGATEEGYLVSGSIPAGTTRVVKTYSSVANQAGSTANYEWHYNRLWRISGSQVLYGAPDYTGKYYTQGTSTLDFNDDANAVLKILEVGRTGLAFFKTTGCYVLYNAMDQSANFAHSGLIQEGSISAAAYVVELNGLAYAANASGLFAINDQGTSEEISAPVRGSISAATLTADYNKKIIVGGSIWAYDVARKRWFNYSGASFTYTTPSVRAGDDGPIQISDVGFVFDLTSSFSPGSIDYQVRFGDLDYGLEQHCVVTDERGYNTFARQEIQNAEAASHFSIRINSLPTGLKLKRVMVRGANLSIR